jgi:hypothetical protein
MKLCVASWLTLFVAVKVIRNVPLAVGVPLSTLVVGLKVTPPGSAPFSLQIGVGVPVAVIAKLPAVPTVNVVLLALVIAGACVTTGVEFTVSVALPLVMLPTVLLTTTENIEPLSPMAVAGVV